MFSNIAWSDWVYLCTGSRGGMRMFLWALVNSTVCKCALKTPQVSIQIIAREDNNVKWKRNHTRWLGLFEEMSSSNDKLQQQNAKKIKKKQSRNEQRNVEINVELKALCLIAHGYIYTICVKCTTCDGLSL